MVFGYIVFQAFTLQEKEMELWDPYKILGVDPGAEEDVIRKAFKRKSLL
jgi:preprotein translocase subunit Sec63